MIGVIAAGLVLAFGFVVFFGAPYVPSLRRELRSAFDELYVVKRGDVVADLGSGDGVVLLHAAQRGARCYGYELNPLLVLLSRIRLGSRATIRLGNMWQQTLPPDVTLVYAFSVVRDGEKLSRYVQTQADAQNRTIRLMTFGSSLPGRTPIKSLRAHNLYEIVPSRD